MGMGRARWHVAALVLGLLCAVGPADQAAAVRLDPEPVRDAPVAPGPTVWAAPADRVDRQWPRQPPWDACPRPVWPGQLSVGSPGDGRRILVIGDSLTRDSLARTDHWLRYSGWTPTFRCWGSRRLDWGIDQVRRSRRIRQLPGWVVVALGTNDISWESQATTERRLEVLLDELGSRRQVLFVNLHLTRSAWLDARAAWFNGVLERWERRRPNVTVIDWHQVARADGVRGWDGIHYDARGFRLRALTVVKAINARSRAVAASR